MEKADITFFDPKADWSVVERGLPHWSQAGCVCFVTWRLIGILIPDRRRPQAKPPIDSNKGPPLSWLPFGGIWAVIVMLGLAGWLIQEPVVELGHRAPHTGRGADVKLPRAKGVPHAMNTAESLPKWNRPGRDLARTPGKCVLNAYLDERSSADALSAGSRGRRGAGAQQERAAAAGLLKRSLERRQL